MYSSGILSCFGLRDIVMIATGRLVEDFKQDAVKVVKVDRWMVLLMKEWDGVFH